MNDPLLPPREAAQKLGISLSSFWRQVARGSLPEPMYPAPKAPRWRATELLAAVEKTRARPREQMAKRRAVKLQGAA
jgi:predicted DNA-binding transcriptional regulator AlpA